MKIKLFAIAVLLIAVFAGAVSAAPTVPVNDNFAGATPLSLTGATKAKHAQLATTELDEDTQMCNGMNVSNTVWFTVDVPYATTLLLRTNTSKLTGVTAGAVQVGMAIYTQSGTGIGGLTLVQCNYEVQPVANSGFVMLDANPENTYYVQVGSLAPYPGAGKWTYIVNSRVLYATTQMANGGFEDPIGASNWKAKDLTNDRIECDNPSYPSYIGDCAFVFEGGPNEKSSLKQTLTMPAGYSFTTGDLFFLAAAARDAGASVENATMKVTVSYSDGKPASVATVALSADSSGVTPHAVEFPLKSGKVKSVKVVIKNKATSGELIVDMVAFAVVSSPTRGAVLPLPAAAR